MRRLVVFNGPYKRLPRKKKKQVKKFIAQLKVIELCFIVANAAVRAFTPYYPKSISYPPGGVIVPHENEIIFDRFVPNNKAINPTL